MTGPTSKANTASRRAARRFLELFYPIHYLVGGQIEDALRRRVLTRQQACILWTIRMEGEVQPDGGRVMRRKDIERAVAEWYEVTSSAISKSLRALSAPPMGLIAISEDPSNGREKLVSLTEQGQRHVAAMFDSGEALIEQITARLTHDEIETGLHFLKRVADIHDALLPEAADKDNEQGAGPTERQATASGR
ncbi:MAG: winged helix DNA-binding protein [Pseudomonadota bacterium]